MVHIIDRSKLGTLSTQDRLNLIGEIWDSLSEKETIAVPPEQIEELERRRARYQKDPSTLQDWDKVKQQIQQKRDK